MIPVLGIRVSAARPAATSASSSARTSAATSATRGSSRRMSGGRSLTSPRDQPAIDVVGSTADVAGALGAQPDDHLGDFAGLAHAAERDAGEDLLAAPLDRTRRH